MITMNTIKKYKIMYTYYSLFLYNKKRDLYFSQNW